MEWDSHRRSSPSRRAPTRLAEVLRAQERIATRRRRGLMVIALGTALLALAAFMVWRGRLSVEDEQQALIARFEQRLDQVADGVPLKDLAGDPGGQPASTAETIVTTGAGDDPRIVVPYDSQDRYEPEPNPLADRLPGILREFPPTEGEVLGRIRIPSIEVDWMLVEGVGTSSLNKGPGHMPWTPLPGQPGNAVISGHRTTYGAPFFDLDLLEDGDLIIIDTLIGTHTYRFVSSMTVLPTGVWVTDQWEGAWLTLTTCTPKFSAAARLVVFAELVHGPNLDAVEEHTERQVPAPPEGV